MSKITSLGIQLTQINLHHSKGTSTILARSMTTMQTKITLIQELWLLNNAIGDLDAETFSTPAQTKNQEDVLWSKKLMQSICQFSSKNLTAIRLRLNLARNKNINDILESGYAL